MKLINFKHSQDFGHNFYINILKFDEFSIFYGCFYTAEYGRMFPYLSLTIGASSLFKIDFSFLKIGFNLCFLTTWCTD